MAYTDERQSVARLLSIFFGSTELKGAIGGLIRLMFMDDPRRANGHLTPYARPVLAIDWEVTCRFLDKASKQAYSLAGQLVKFNFAMSDGTTGYEEIGKCVPRDWDSTYEPTPGGPPGEQTFRAEDTALTHNIVN